MPQREPPPRAARPYGRSAPPSASHNGARAYRRHSRSGRSRKSRPPSSRAASARIQHDLAKNRPQRLVRVLNGLVGKQQERDAHEIDVVARLHANRDAADDDAAAMLEVRAESAKLLRVLILARRADAQLPIRVGREENAVVQPPRRRKARRETDRPHRHYVTRSRISARRKSSLPCPVIQ